MTNEIYGHCLYMKSHMLSQMCYTFERVDNLGTLRNYEDEMGMLKSAQHLQKEINALKAGGKKLQRYAIEFDKIQPNLPSWVEF